MTWDNRDVHAPFGARGRAEPGGDAGPGLYPAGRPPAAFPLVRPRAMGVLPQAALKYERVDGPAAPVTQGDNDALLFVFSGRPDSIMLAARAFPVLFTLTDRLRRESTRILVPVDGTVETFIARDTVLARNAIAGSNGVAHCVGKWAELDEASSAY